MEAIEDCAKAEEAVNESKLKTMLHSAVLSAFGNYTNYHGNSANKNNNAFNRGQGGGFFSWLRHGANGLAIANDFRDSFYQTDDLSQTTDKIQNFLKDSSRTYHQHSFATYLADALAEKGIITAHRSGHYEQKQVVNEFEQWFGGYQSTKLLNYRTISL